MLTELLLHCFIMRVSVDTFDGMDGKKSMRRRKN
jgi:hypothetical protein